ncbi:hypothetical protein CPB83DRAFT_842241 [Crepidotus variabilis]|uniref:25S rRNA (uridine-N(3))-methyltransferase BMT5-like domain-containing protein n=1 Tax=Crepidotus variabilis TaxID=179855 RepID=A0A9P6ET67_9AGAR|nr:hypothetical protein CPB83DRAFT_842241 [Crepidotus variabilis]
MGKGKGLKAALQTQQSRLKSKQKLSHSVQVAEDKVRRKRQSQPVSPHKTENNKKSADGSRKKPSLSSRTIKVPFKPTDRILLIGEGNFSFARALVVDPPLALAFLPPENITATAYDTEDECYEKYPESHAIINSLKERGVEVLFGVDGTRIERISTLKGRKWDRIVWNFPHAGKGITDQDRNILSNQMLFLGFLRSAARFLQEGPTPVTAPPKKKRKLNEDEDKRDDHETSDSEDDSSPQQTSHTRGTVLVTLRNVIPYSQWDLPRLAKNPPPPVGSTPPNPLYTQLRSFQFHRSLWKGYEHRMTKGERAYGKGTTGEGGEDRTWEFCLRDVS